MIGINKQNLDMIICRLVEGRSCNSRLVKSELLEI